VADTLFVSNRAEVSASVTKPGGGLAAGAVIHRRFLREVDNDCRRLSSEAQFSGRATAPIYLCRDLYINVELQRVLPIGFATGRRD
jgi:hypothetical protein